MNRLIPSSLRSRLVLLVLIATLPALGLILADAAEQRAASAADAQRNALVLAQATAMQHTHAIGEARRLLSLAADLPANLSSDTAACGERLADLLRISPGYGNIAVISLSGDVRCSAVPISRPVNVGGQRWFQRVVATEAFATGEYFIGPITGRPVLALGQPVRDQDGRLAAVVSASLDLTALGDLPSTTPLPPGTTVAVLDGSGEVLLRTPAVEQLQGEAARPLIEQVLAQGTGTAELPGLDGVVRLYGFARLAPNGEGAFLVIGVPRAAADAAANAMLARNLTALAVAAALALAAAWFGGDWLLLRRLHPIVGAARRLETGDLTARTGQPHRGHGELSELAHAFDQMAATIQHRDAELRAASEERLAFERKLQETQRLESLGVLAGGIAHDFNNLLAIIRGNTTLALDDLPGDAPLRQLLGPIDLAARRAGDLTRQMLAYAGRGRIAVEPVNLNDLIGEAGELLRSSLPATVTLAYDLDPTPLLAIADVTQIRQVLMNLIINAGESLGETSGTVTITTGTCTPDPAFLRACVVAPAEPQPEYVAVVVADTGIGMDEATLARIFDPFFTTKFLGRGLGLAAVLGIVRGHGGALHVASAPAEGTVFTVLLPAVAVNELAASV